MNEQTQGTTIVEYHADGTQTRRTESEAEFWARYNARHAQGHEQQPAMLPGHITRRGNLRRSRY